MIVQVVKYKSGLADDEVRRVIAERAPRYEALPRLRQKLYIREPETGEYGGIYVWDDEESMREFRQSDLAATIPEAYRVEGSRGSRSSNSSRCCALKRASCRRLSALVTCGDGDTHHGQPHMSPRPRRVFPWIRRHLRMAEYRGAL